MRGKEYRVFSMQTPVIATGKLSLCPVSVRQMHRRDLQCSLRGMRKPSCCHPWQYDVPGMQTSGWEIRFVIRIKIESHINGH